MTHSSSAVTVRDVRESDREAVLSLIRPFVDAQRLLPRTTAELSALCSCAFVAECAGEIVGFAALEIYSPKLAEIRSLAVSEAFQGQGVGRQLVDACVHASRERNVLEVMAISSSETFFRACGFDFTLPGEKKAFFYSTRPRLND